jgi:integrase/recombinase XerD
MENKPMPTTPALEHIDRFLATISVPGTQATYRYGLAALAQFMHDMDYGTELRDDVLLKFYEYLSSGNEKRSPATRDNYLAAVKRFLTWLDANDYLPPGFQVGKAINRLKIVRGTRRSTQAGREPDPDLPRIVTYYDEIPLPENKTKRLEILRARAIVHTLYASAGRVSEVASLTREMVLDGRKAEVRITGKGNKDRLLLLTKEAQNAIAAYCRERTDKFPGLFISHGRGLGGRLSRKTLWMIVKQATNALGLYKGTSPHAFRHYRAQQLLHEGMDLDVLQSYLGHADIGTTRRVYAPFTSTEKVRDQLETFGRTAQEETTSHGE